MAVELWRTTNPSTQKQSYLHESNWESHAAKRVEIREHLQSVRQTVEDPDFALQDERGVIFKYRKGFGKGKFARLWLAVVEQADADDAHYVKTAYFTSHIMEHTPIYIAWVS